MSRKENITDDISELKDQHEKLSTFIEGALKRANLSKAKLSTYPSLSKISDTDFTESDYVAIKCEVKAGFDVAVNAQKLLAELSELIKELNDKLLFISE